MSWVEERARFALADIDPARQTGLEFGPLDRPLIQKRQGDVRYVDHDARTALVEKYRNDANVRVENIVDVDYVWGDRSLPEIVAGQKFDYAIASHVIEHVPDLVGWLDEIAAVLRPGGRLSLVVPDKRYTFDILRDLTSPADIVDAYLRRLRRPSFRCIYDFGANFTGVNLAQLWSGDQRAEQLTPAHGASHGLALARLASGGPYVDVHCWVFTPASFVKLLETLFNLQLVQFRIASFVPTPPGSFEFYVHLERLPGELTAEERLRIQMDSMPRVADPLSEANPALPGQLQELVAQNAALREQIGAILRSRSWRATAMPRRVVTWLRQLLGTAAARR